MNTATLKRKYGLTMEDFAKLGEVCGWACPICLKPFAKDVLGNGSRRACVDHDHSTGRVRGLVCAACNYEIGVRGDNAEWFERAAAHLRGPLAVQVLGDRFIPGSPGNPEDDDDE